jgi:FkbM family methyltransferase
MKVSERFAPSRMKLVAKDVGGRIRRYPQGLWPPRAAIRCSMSRGTAPHSNRHRWLQERYRHQRIKRFLRPEVRTGELAFDIGANVGEWSAVMRDLGARVLAVEPQVSCAASMRERFADDSDIRVVESAVGDWVGPGTLWPATTSTEHASMSSEWRETVIAKGYLPADVWLEPVEVPVRTLDSLIDEFDSPSFCKIDVEGFEPQVLRGLSHPIPALAFEFHRELAEAVEACVERLTELGTYRYEVFTGEWQDPTGGGLPADTVVAEVARLAPGTLGMIKASRI